MSANELVGPSEALKNELNIQKKILKMTTKKEVKSASVAKNEILLSNL
jgi:hypothetical protein